MIRIAVDLDDELALMAEAVRTAERAALMVAWLAQRRSEAEADEHDRHEDWLCHSDRTKRLAYAAAGLEHAAELLSEAMVASSVIDDDIPF